MRFSFNEKQLELLNRLNLGFDPAKDLTDEEYFKMDEAVGDHLLAYGFKNYDDYDTNKVGDVCESIMTIISNV